jgi:hypothetical protein
MHNYPGSTRAAKNELHRNDLVGPNDGNPAKYLSFRRMHLTEAIKDKMDPAMIMSPKWNLARLGQITTPAKPKDGYITVKDLEQIQDVKDLLFGGFNIEKHESNIIKNKIVGVKDYVDFNPEECKERMKDLSKYNSQMSGMKNRVSHIDPKYFEKKRESLRPEIKRQKINADAGVVEKVKPMDYLPSHLFDKDISEALQPEKSGILTRDDSQQLISAYSSYKNNKKFVTYK